MPAQETIEELVFTGGLRQKESPILQAQGFTKALNCYQEKTGELVKFHGFTEFSDEFKPWKEGSVSHSTIGDNPRLLKLGKQKACVANGYLYAKNDEWVLQGRVSPWVCEQRSVIELDADTSKNKFHDSCVSGEWLWVAFYDRVVGTHLPSGKTTELYRTAETMTRCRLVKWDDDGSVAHIWTTGSALRYRKLSPGGYTASAATLVGFSGTQFDVAARSTLLALVYSDGTDVTVARCTIGDTTISVAADTTESATGVHAVACAVSSARIAAMWAFQEDLGGWLHGVAAASYSAGSLASVWGPTGIWDETVAEQLSAGDRTDRLGCCHTTDNKFFFLWTNANAEYTDIGQIARPYITMGRCVADNGTADSSYRECRRIEQRSRPVYDATLDRVFFLAEDPLHYGGFAALHRSYYIMGTEVAVDLSRLRFRPMAHMGYLVAGRRTASRDTGDNERQTTLVQDAEGKWYAHGLESAGQGLVTHVIREYKLVADDRVGVSATLGNQTYLTGALVSAWDGMRVMEAGWLQDPEWANEPNVSTGDGLPAGTYTYKLTYARLSATGEILRSIPSEDLPATITSGPKDVTLQAYRCHVTNLMSDDHSLLELEIWRTRANEAGPFFRVASIPMDPNSALVLEYTDDLIDNSLQRREQLYSDGGSGEVPNDPPPPALSIAEWRNRLWVTDGESIWYTKEGVTARSVEFSALQSMPRALQSPLTAIAPLADVLAVFSEDGTGYVFGEGPAASGTGSTLTGPIALQSELGCTAAGGLSVVPNGLLVPTRRGLHFLGLDRAFRYIGAAVETELKSFPRVRAASHIGGTNLVWIAVANESGTAGKFLVFDTHHESWTTALDDKAPVSVIATDGEQTWCESTGETHDATPAAYLLSADGYSQMIETPWLKPAGINGQLIAKHAWLLCKQLGASDLQIEIGYDYSDSYEFTTTVTADELSEMGGDQESISKLEIPIPRTECHAIRFRFTETAEVGSAGFRFHALRMLVGRSTQRTRYDERNRPTTWEQRATNPDYVAALRALSPAPAFVDAGISGDHPDANKYSIPASTTGLTILFRMVVVAADWAENMYDDGSFSGGDFFANILRKVDTGQAEWAFRFCASGHPDTPGRLSVHAFNLAGGAPTDEGASAAFPGEGRAIWIVTRRVYHVAAAFDHSGSGGLTLYLDGHAVASGDYADAGVTPTAGTAIVSRPTASASPVSIRDLAIVPTKLSAIAINQLARIGLKE